MRGWLPPAIGYALAIGGLGLTIKLALRTVEWPVLLLAVAVTQVALTFAFSRQIVIPRSGGSWIVFTIATGILAAGAFPLFNIALRSGPVSQVVPISAAFPLVSVVLAALFLGEHLSLARSAGVALIVAGSVLVSRT